MVTKTLEQQHVTDLSKSVEQLQCSVSNILVTQQAAYIQAPPVTVLLLQTKECLDNARALLELCIRQVNALFDIYDNVDLEVRVMLDTAYFKSPALLALNGLSTVLAAIETILVLFSAPIAEDRQSMPYGSHLRASIEYDVLKALCTQADITATEVGDELETMPADWVSYVTTKGEAQMRMPIHDKYNTYFGDEPGEQL